MKRPGILLCTVFALFTSLALAQEDMDEPMGPPQPAKELEKFSRLIGYWQGQGTSRMGPSKPMAKWTSTSHVRKVLGGHFLREDTHIESDSWQTPLQFISFFGYDQHKKRHIKIDVSNFGTAERTEISFQDDDTMVSASTKLLDGKRTVERWITRLGEGKVSYVGNMVIGDGEWFVHVKGTSTKVDGKPKTEIVDAAFMGMTSNDNMGKLKGMTGTWKFKGEMLMSPGMPMIPISGESITERLFGGMVLRTIVNGDPVNGQAYKGWYAMVWDPAEQNYVSVAVNNLGHSAIETGVWVSGTELLFTSALPWYGGIPSAYSGVMKCADDGTLKSYISHSIIGTHEPVKSFQIEYTKK